MRYKQIIWDWNGTLIDDVWLCLEIINGLLAKYGKRTMTLEEYRAVFDFPVKDYYRRIGFDFAETPFEIVGTEFMDDYWRRWVECDLQTGAREFCEFLYAQNVPQVIISAAETRLLQACVTHFGIAHFFSQLWGLDHHYATSKEGLAKEFVAATPVAPAEMVFIGDTLHDCHVAQAAGVQPALFCGGHHPRAKLETCGAPVFDSLAEIKKFLLQD